MTEMRSPLFGDEYHKRGVSTLPQCSMCGRPLKGKTSLVHYLTNGMITTERDASNTQGFWEIGPECGKKIPAAFRFSR